MATALMLAAWAIEVAVGWPERIYARIRHPVVWIGVLISFLERHLNKKALPHGLRYLAGVVTALSVVGVTTGVAGVVSWLLPNSILGIFCEALIASSLLASRSLYAHVVGVLRELETGNISAARDAVGRIVGRDPQSLDNAGIVRASLESLAENASDGVVAPLFWGILLGLPGLAACKAINTLDSMIGHRSEAYLAFGCFAARLDDVVNFIPARITGIALALAGGHRGTWRIMWRDASRHRSPNAGWPESAMAGALAIRLSGPRIYAGQASSDPWLNAAAPDPMAVDLRRGLHLYVRAMLLLACAIAVVIAGGVAI